MDGEARPQLALAPRVLFVAVEGETIVGFIAGHLTRRFGCDGELQWVNVVPERRGTGVATELLRMLAGWFVEHSARGVCVDVDPENPAGRRFYTKHGAEPLNPHWFVWQDISSLVENAPPSA